MNFFGWGFQRGSKESHQQLSVVTDPVGAVTFSQSKEDFNKALQGEQSVELKLQLFEFP